MRKPALLLALIALAALWSAAHVSAATPPPAVSFDINLQVTAPDAAFATEIKGVANQSGDAQISIASSDPDIPPMDLINVNGVAYLSIDGGPYQAMADNAGLPIGGTGHGGKRPLMELPSGCRSTLEQFHSMLLAPDGTQVLKNIPGIQDLGPASVNGITAEHYGGSLSFDALLANPLVSLAVNQVIAACGQSFGVDRAQLQSFLTGSSASLDAYLDSDNLPRQFNLTFNLASLQLQFSASGTLTPLPAPAAISAP